MQGIGILVLAVIIALIIIVLMKCGDAEKFDTYYNHTLGAEDVYNAELKSVGKSIDFSGAQLVSRYTWASKDPTGRNVYDKYYEAVVQEKNAGVGTGGESDGTDVSKAIDTQITPYDSKFDVYPKGNPNLYNLRDMYDNEPMFTEVMGETIVLSQANY